MRTTTLNIHSQRVAVIELMYSTPAAWAECVVADMDHFLPDHAAAEKKASSMAMAMVAHYPDKVELVTAMVDLAIEELNHYRAVVTIIHQRGITLLPDEKDPYVNAMRAEVRHGKSLYFMDRLLVAGIVEARGAERFGLLAEYLPEGSLKRFYSSIARSELEHQDLFVRLAGKYFDNAEIDKRLSELLVKEAGIIKGLPIRAALH